MVIVTYELRQNKSGYAAIHQLLCLRYQLDIIVLFTRDHCIAKLDILNPVENDIFWIFDDPICVGQQKCPFVYGIKTFDIKSWICLGKSKLLRQEKRLVEVKLFFKHLGQDEIG